MTHHLIGCQCDCGQWVVCTYTRIDIHTSPLYAHFGESMRFEWDDKKNRQNLLKHQIAFETAALVFDDPYAITQRDPAFDDEERWITVGAVDFGSILLVVHIFFESSEEEVIRIISARAAESHERKAYEEAHKATKARHPRHRRKDRRGY
jgi:uncharacterized protein